MTEQTEQTTDTGPALRPVDAVAVSYRAAADVIHGGTHAARDGYEARLVDDEQLAARLAAIDEATSALLIAAAVLRDSLGETRPSLAGHLQRATSGLMTAAGAVTDARRGHTGPAYVELDD